MEKQLIPKLLLIAGTGRNSGKTTFACNIIRKFYHSYPIVAIKISAHFHEDVKVGNVIFSDKNLFVGEETETDKVKDSSRMLAAGARKSFFIMAKDEQLQGAFRIILSIVAPENYIVCESGSLLNYTVPDLFFMLNRSDNLIPKPKSIQLKKMCDRLITFNGQDFDFSLDLLEIKHNKWILTE